MEYFTRIPTQTQFDEDVKISWNVANISGGDSEGYIVQYLEREIPFTFVGDAVEYQKYFEAWYVKDGHTGSKCGYDDNWYVISEDLILDYEDEIMKSQSSVATYKAKVYWIPAGCDEFEDIKQWRSNPEFTAPSGELPMVCQYSKDLSKYFVCNRAHQWDYKDILQQIKRNKKHG